MTAIRIFRAVPLAPLQGCQHEVSIPADSIVAALVLAKGVFGEGTAFDLCEGAKVVLSYRPAQKSWPLGGGQG